MGSIELTASKHLFPMVAILTEGGQPLEPLLGRSGLPGHCLDEPETLVPTAALWRFRELAANRAGLPDLTLVSMERLSLGELGLVGQTLSREPTLAAMIRTFQRIVPSETSTAIIEVATRSSGDLFFSTRFTLRQGSGRWQAESYLLAWMLKIVQFVDPAWRPREIWCSSEPTPERMRALQSLTARPRFNRSRAGFSVPATLLARPPVSAASGNRSSESLEERMWSTAPADSTVGAVQQLIRAYAEDGWLTLEQAADCLGTSVRTIQRDLSAEQTTFSEILEESRAKAASGLLVSADATLSDVARRLGYSNLSNFNRAFRRWSGVSPGEFRSHRGSTPRTPSRDGLFG